MSKVEMLRFIRLNPQYHLDDIQLCFKVADIVSQDIKANITGSAVQFLNLLEAEQRLIDVNKIARPFLKDCFKCWADMLRP